MDEKQRIISEESFHTVRDEKGELLLVLGRDPSSKKHLVYKCAELTSSEIVEYMGTKAPLSTGK